MTQALIICDGATVSKEILSQKFDEQIRIGHIKPSREINLRIENISHAVLQDVDARASDFVRIAAYVYAADQSISRGGKSDMYGKRWKREMTFSIPVQDVQFWNENSINSQLCNILNFLTGDKYQFEFSPIQMTNIQLIFDVGSKEKLYYSPDCVILFSGGADSLCAVVEAIASQGRKPILISHRPAFRHDAVQWNLVRLLRKQFSQWAFPHIAVWVHRMGSEAKETTQRSRSFLYATLGAVIAKQLDLNDIFLPDNGIVTLNLPKTPQLIGTLASRSTHPKFISNFNNLCKQALSSKLSVSNPLLYYTRAETMSILKKHHSEKLLQETVSCANWRGRPRITPHCGVCSQCIDRRFGSISAGLEKFDLVERYGVDIFTDSLSEGEIRTQAESHVRFAVDVDDLSEEELLERFVELYDCISIEDTNPNDTISKFLELLKRHSKQVLEVLYKELRRFRKEMVKGVLPDTCLLKLVATGTHLSDVKNEYALYIGEVLKKALPVTFQTSKPHNEREVQDACESAIMTTKIGANREVPQLPFAGISARPDFSKKLVRSTKDWLYLEMKYPKDRSRLNKIVTEITSRIIIYEKQGAYVLFGVYDPERTIVDDDRFISDLDSISINAWFVVIR